MLLVEAEAGKLRDESGWLGRGFMEHPRDYSLTLAAGVPSRRLEFLDTHVVDGATVCGRLALREEAILREDLPSASVTVLPMGRSLRPFHWRLERLARRRFGVSLQWPPGFGWSRLPRFARRFSGFQVLINFEEFPHPDNRLVLDSATDALGVRRARLQRRWQRADAARHERLRSLIALGLAEIGLGPLARRPARAAGRQQPSPHGHDAHGRRCEDRRHRRPRAGLRHRQPVRRRRLGVSGRRLRQSHAHLHRPVPPACPVAEGRHGVRDGPGYLLVIPWGLAAPGGVSQIVASLHRELGALGWNPTVLVPTWAATAPAVDDTGTIPVLRWRIRSPWSDGNAAKSLIAFLLTFPAFAWRWRELARRHDWQVVNFHYPGLSALTWIALKRLKLWRGAVVLSVHGREVRDPQPPRGAVARRLMAYLLANADAVVACSEELARDVLRIAPGAAGHLRVVANGISAEALQAEFDPSFVLPDGLSGCRYVLNVATFEHKKAQDVLVDAFALVAARQPDVRLVLVGRSTPWLGEIRQRAAGLGIAHRVHFFSDVPHYQVLSFLARASLFCLPSRAEGHPVAILEAAALGIPVVSTPVGGIAQTIPDDSHGLLVPVGDVHALADALCRLLADPELARRLGQNLQRLVQSEFTGSQSARRYTDLARSLGVGCDHNWTKRERNCTEVER